MMQINQIRKYMGYVRELQEPILAVDVNGNAGFSVCHLPYHTQPTLILQYSPLDTVCLLGPTLSELPEAILTSRKLYYGSGELD